MTARVTCGKLSHTPKCIRFTVQSHLGVERSLIHSEELLLPSWNDCKGGLRQIIAHRKMHQVHSSIPPRCWEIANSFRRIAVAQLNCVVIHAFGLCCLSVNTEMRFWGFRFCLWFPKPRCVVQLYCSNYCMRIPLPPPWSSSSTSSCHRKHMKMLMVPGISPLGEAATMEGMVTENGENTINRFIHPLQAYMTGWQLCVVRHRKKRPLKIGNQIFKWLDWLR